MKAAEPSNDHPEFVVGRYWCTAYECDLVEPDAPLVLYRGEGLLIGELAHFIRDPMRLIFRPQKSRKIRMGEGLAGDRCQGDLGVKGVRLGEAGLAPKYHRGVALFAPKQIPVPVRRAVERKPLICEPRRHVRVGDAVE